MKSNAYSCALRLLTRREHGAQELIDKLVQKGYLMPDIQESVLACQAQGFQSDRRFADMVCRARIRQGYGPVRIAQELKQKQIDAEVIHEVLEEERDHWVFYAIQARKKKYKEQGELPYGVLQKQKQFLRYRGFSIETISMVFNSNDDSC